MFEMWFVRIECVNVEFVGVGNVLFVRSLHLFHPLSHIRWKPICTQSHRKLDYALETMEICWSMPASQPTYHANRHRIERMFHTEIRTHKGTTFFFTRYLMILFLFFVSHKRCCVIQANCSILLVVVCFSFFLVILLFLLFLLLMIKCLHLLLFYAHSSHFHSQCIV